MPLPSFPESFNLADYFLYDRLREGLGQRIALRFGQRTYSYDHVAARSRAFTALLSNVDVRRGERVLVVLPDVPAFAWALMGTFARGAVVAMGNPHGGAEAIAYLVEYTRATALVTTEELAEALAEKLETKALGSELRAVFVSADEPTDGNPERPVKLPRGPRFHDLEKSLQSLGTVGPTEGRLATHRDEPAMWLFTSGSTGKPKANVHAHRDFAFNTEVYAKGTVGYRADDLTVSVPRLFFGYATGTNLFFPFAVGASVGLFSERPTPESLAAAVARYKPTVVTNVPTMLGKLLDHDEEARQRGEQGLDFSSVRFQLSAGEALPEALLQRWLARFGSEVYDGIGSAEMFHIYASNRPGDVRPGSLGKAVAGYELAILPEEAEGFGARPCAPGEIGVLWVRGDSVSMGYWLDRDKSFRTFHGHVCRTGDLFRMDPEGYLYFAGRADELLKVSGQWLSPLEVEECLMKHEAVSLAAVIGVTDNGLVKPKAYVICRPGFQGDGVLAEQLQVHVKTHLLPFKYPRTIEFVSELPRNDRGKVDRKALRALATPSPRSTP